MYVLYTDVPTAQYRRIGDEESIVRNRQRICRVFLNFVDRFTIMRFTATEALTACEAHRNVPDE
jgi:hypothetical protein